MALRRFGPFILRDAAPDRRIAAPGAVRAKAAAHGRGELILRREEMPEFRFTAACDETIFTDTRLRGQ